MSLRQVLTVDRSYVAKRYEEPQGYQNLQEAAEDVVRMKLVPLFTMLHYRGAFRTAGRLKMSVNFADDKLYNIHVTPKWDLKAETVAEGNNKSHFVQVYYSEYFNSYNRSELWEEVVKVAAKEEWQIEGTINLEKKKATLILDMS